jgi:hypothetical protein
VPRAVEGVRDVSFGSVDLWPAGIADGCIIEGVRDAQLRVVHLWSDGITDTFIRDLRIAVRPRVGAGGGEERGVLYVWAKDEPYGAELVELVAGAGTLRAEGVAIGTEPAPYRLEYELTTTGGYVTARLLVRARGEGWGRVLDLRRSSSGAWSCTTGGDGGVELPPPGGDLAAVAGALDCDLALSPLTNTMPVLRAGLHERPGSEELLVAWVSVPDLGVRPSRQRYTFVRGGPERVVRFDSLDSPFSAELRLDERAVVLDYPGIGRRVA